MDCLLAVWLYLIRYLQESIPAHLKFLSMSYTLENIPDLLTLNKISLRKDKYIYDDFKNFTVNVVNLWLLVLFVLSKAAIASGTYNPFIYFRF